jgi:hypothetical protein
MRLDEKARESLEAFDDEASEAAAMAQRLVTSLLVGIAP